MFRLPVFAALFLFLTLSGSTTGFAQAPQAMLQNEQPAGGISESELTSFANAYQVLRTMNKESEREMLAIVTENDLDLKRFNEIHKASLAPDSETNMTPEEQDKYSNITAQLERKQLRFQKNMEKVILEHGLTMKRYEEIAVSLQKDPSLQKRLEKVMKG